MLPFLLGLLVGGIFGIVVMAILSVGSIAEDNMEYMIKHINLNSKITSQQNK